MLFWHGFSSRQAKDRAVRAFEGMGNQSMLIFGTLGEWFDTLKWQINRHRKGTLEHACAEHEKHIVNRTTLVRDGIWFIFIERDDGIFQINAQRRTRPFLRATFMADKPAGEAWKDDGLVPAGETAELFEQFRAGKWPLPIPGSG